MENTVSSATLSEETLDGAIRTEGWPQSYSYVFSPWAEIMGYQVNEAHLEDVGAVPLLVDALYELTLRTLPQQATDVPCSTEVRWITEWINNCKGGVRYAT